MNIVVVTTVAQHRAGIQLHLANLKWALQKHNVRIVVRTFSEWSLAEWSLHTSDLEVIEHRVFPFHYFPFWDHANEQMQKHIGWADAFLLIEQDVLFTKVIDDIPTEAIVINLESYYLSVYTPSVDRFYPRIWDGATFVPASVIAKAIESGISLGSKPRQLVTGGSLDNSMLDSFHTTNGWPWNYLPSLREYTVGKDLFDTMLEFTVYCFVTQVPINRWTRLENDYQYSEAVVHLRGIDTLVLDCPGVYEDLNLLGMVETSRTHLEWFYNDCAMMLLLSGVHLPSPLMASKLRHYYGSAFTDWTKLDRPGSVSNIVWLKKKMGLLAANASEWMPPATYDRFIWGSGVLDDRKGC